MGFQDVMKEEIRRNKGNKAKKLRRKKKQKYNKKLHVFVAVFVGRFFTRTY